MRKILIHIFVLFLCQNLFSQNTGKFDKIILVYDYGNFPTNNIGVFDTKEIIEIDLTKNGDYKIQKYTKSQKSYDGKNNNHSTKELNTERIKSIDFEIVEDLLKELNTNKLNFASVLLNEKLIKPQKDLILRMAKSSSTIKKILNESYTFTKENESELLRFKYFDEFIEKETPKEKTLYVMTDSWRNLTITAIKKNDTIKYKCITHYDIGQPIDITQSDKTKRIVNLSVNKIILNILPKESHFRKAFDFNNITQKYIHWYLMNKVK
jgi:hypothetical protein